LEYRELKLRLMKSKIVLFVALVFLMASCGQEQKKAKTIKAPKKAKVIVKVPDFNADSAYKYVAKQVEFGPRVPGSKAHAACANYFVNFFENLGLQVTQQKFKSRAFDGKVLNGINIIASTRPESTHRVLLCSHWDSRPFADHDPDSKNHQTPIDGANDGASGVGILMEVARQMSIKDPTIGIDILLLDLEDYGQHAGEQPKPNSELTWALGSQYWSKNPHIAGYDARFGILLDMVGATGATFYKEYYSNNYAPGILDIVWNAAAAIGYGDYFKKEERGAVIDDHVFINKYAYIPTIDIIHHDLNTKSNFFPYWHTVGDNMDNIDTFSLKMVGQTLLEVIYKEK